MAVAVILLALLLGLVAPYPPGPVVREIRWHWETLRSAAPGSDLWPVAEGPDGNLYTAWGDGGGFGGSDQEGRVSMGFARIEGEPENFRGININGGRNALNPASFPKKGKTSGLVFVGRTLYASVNQQDGPWPDVTHVLVWSADLGATWSKAGWVFPKGAGRFQPETFLSFDGFVYLYGHRIFDLNRLYLARVPAAKIRDRAAYEFFDEPVFTDPNGTRAATVVYHPGLKRFLLTTFHTGPGQLGVFDGPTPRGPWTTVAYYDDWGGMGREGEGLLCSFPTKWMSADGLTLWSVFSVYGAGAKQGINAHDRFNLIKATLTLKAP